MVDTMPPPADNLKQARRRSGSNQRKRKHQIGVRLDDVELAVLDRFATEFGCPRPEVLRRLLVTDALFVGLR